MIRAMILAAGLGSRLGAITSDTPKCLVKAGTKVMLEHVIDNLKRAGVTSVVINLHYLSDKVTNFVAERENFGLEVIFSYETELLGTGGAILNARRFLEQETSFFVHNADVYSDIDLKSLLAQHEETNALATLAVRDRTTTRPLLFSNSGTLIGWESSENRSGECLSTQEGVVRRAFCGIQVVSPKIFDYMQREEKTFSIIRAYMNASRQGEKIQACSVDSSYWLDVGRPEHLSELQTRLESSYC